MGGKAGDLLSEVAFIAWKLDFDISFIHQRQLVYSAANKPSRSILNTTPTSSARILITVFLSLQKSLVGG
jgi:hypothetical protein